jgi:uncharacterized protein YbjT (DUF2867 family)
MTPILVFGATGNVGRHVVEQLQRREAPVRAFVRDRERGAAVLGDGVELAVGDLDDRGSIDRALDGVDRVFLACGNVPGQVELESNAIDAMTAAGTSLVVKLSAAAAAPDSPLLFPRWQGDIEQHLTTSRLPAVVLKPMDYMTNVLTFANGIRQTSKLFAPLGGAKTAMIAPRDVGEVAAVTLTEDGHAGNAYVLTGPESITYDQIVAELSRATGQPLAFVDVPEQAAHSAMLEQGMPEFLADFLIALFGAMRNGIADQVTDTVRLLTGREPTTFGAFADEHAAAFGA